MIAATSSRGARAFLLVLLIGGVTVLGVASTPAQQSTAEHEAIEAVLEDYVVGWREGNAERLGRAFAPTGAIVWPAEGNDVNSMTFAAAIGRDRSNPSYGLEWNVESLDIVDDHVAVARVNISRTGGSYVDLLTLYKLDAGWRIVNKAFVTRSE